MNYDLVPTEYNTCNCTNKHVPKSHKLFRLDIDDASFYLCPTSFYNVVTLLEHWNKLGKEPPGSTRKHFSSYVQRLAKLKFFS